MFETAFTLGLTHFARSLSTPERLQRRTGRNAALEAWRLRNTGLDALFYDVRSLTADEVFYVSDSIAAEGLIMIVPPTGGPMLTICDTIEEYMLRGGAEVHVMAIAGIGGSALGAAAFARNIADAVGEPVAAVVSGYGLGDIINEAIGGAFLFGWLGAVRHECQVVDDVVGRPHLGAWSDRHVPSTEPRRTCLDVDTVQALLSDPRLSFHLLAGHSKGNLVLSEALHALKGEYPAHLKALGQRARIVTFGARIPMPPECAEIIDVMGELDWYGEMNSRPRMASEVRVPLAGHSTNTDLVGSLPVTAILQDITQHQAEVPEPKPEAPDAAEPAPPEPPKLVAVPKVEPPAEEKPEAIVAAAAALATVPLEVVAEAPAKLVEAVAPTPKPVAPKVKAAPAAKGKVAAGKVTSPAPTPAPEATGDRAPPARRTASPKAKKPK